MKIRSCDVLVEPVQFIKLTHLRIPNETRLSTVETSHLFHLYASRYNNYIRSEIYVLEKLAVEMRYVYVRLCTIEKSNTHF